MSERRIVRVEHVSDVSRVFLDDGSELKGLKTVSAVNTTNGLSTVSIEAYIFRERNND